MDVLPPSDVDILVVDGSSTYSKADKLTSAVELNIVVMIVVKLVVARVSGMVVVGW